MDDAVPFTFGLCAAYVLVLFAGVFASIYLFRLYRRVDAEQDREGALTRRGWAGKLEFTPEDLGGFSYWQLALASVVGLFLELLLIRWVSSEIRVFAYFKNFVLIACFLGFGLGCYLCRRRVSVLPILVPLLTLVLLIYVPWVSLRYLVADLPYWWERPRTCFCGRCRPWGMDGSCWLF